MPLVEDDHMVETLTSNGADHPFDKWILPRGARCGKDLLDPETVDASIEVRSVGLVSIPYQVPRRRVPWKSIDHLLRRPVPSIYSSARTELAKLLIYGLFRKILVLAQDDVSIRYTERLAEAGIEPSVGSQGDSYDNALAESIIGLYKTEVIRRRGPWRGTEDVEFATLEWVHWYNTQRLLEPIGNVAPVEYEMNYYRSQEGLLEMARLN